MSGLSIYLPILLAMFSPVCIVCMCDKNVTIVRVLYNLGLHVGNGKVLGKPALLLTRMSIWLESAETFMKRP